MMGGTPLRIDRSTGVITATPDQIGQFLIGVVVEEYRNGVLIGSTKRDFEFNVRACGDKPDVSFDVLTDKCDGLTQIFKNTSSNANKYTWYFDHPRTQPSSMEESPTFTYDSAGTYTVVLVAENDQGCIDSATVVIEVLDPQLNPNFTFEVDCNDSLKLLVTNTSTSNYQIVSYEWTITYSGGTLTSSEEHPMFLLSESGVVTIKLKITDEFGCMEVKEVTTTIEDFDLEFIQDSFDICLGDEIKLIKNGDPNLQYTWSPTDGLKLDPPHDPRACPTTSTTYCVTVTDGNCTKSGCVYVGVTDTIPVDIMGPDSTCNGLVNLMAVSDSMTTFDWATDPSFNDIIAVGDKLDTIIDKTTTFYVRAGGDIKCPGITSHTVVFFDAVVENIDREPIICFGPGMIELNPGGNEDYVYSWSPGEYLDDSTSHNPKATLDKTTKFTVHIINPTYPQCPDTIMVNVRVGDTLEIIGLPTGKEVMVDPSDIDFIVVKATDTLDCTIRDTMNIELYKLDINIIAPDTICAGDTIMIMLINNGSDSLMIEWEPASEIIGTNEGPVIKVSPNTTTIYTAFIKNGKGCEWERDITINVGGFTTPIEVTATPMEFNPGECTQLDVNIEGNVTYMWTGEGLDDPTIKSPKATILEPGMYTYTVKITDEMGCMIIGTITVKVRTPDCEDGVFLPNAFSPNNDGFNDVFIVRSFFVQSMELIIFDRWGEVVFLSTSQSKGWDGTFRGTTLSPDVYGYRLKYTCIDGEDYVKSGNVTLLK
jgi:gliding motility-associated-like protein